MRTIEERGMMEGKKRCCVVVVDDDEFMRKSISRILLVNGIDAECYGCGEEYLKCSGATDPVCLVLDLQLPGIDGLVLQEKILHEGGPPVVFISGCGSVATSVAAMKGGAVDFLEKPFSESDLVEAIERAAEQGASERERKSRLKNAALCFEKLTTREIEVMWEVVKGRLNKQIASDLGISEKTIKVHRGRVMEKMEVDSVAELVRCADLLEEFRLVGAA